MATPRRTLESLRSQRWFAADEHARVRPPPALAGHRHAPRRLHGQAGDRDRQHVERPLDLPRAPARPRGSGEARRLAGGRLSGGAARALRRRDHGQADDDALPQLPRDGDRGAPARAPGGCRRAARRLRQVDAGTPDGRDQHGHPRDLLPRRADVQRLVARHQGRRRHAHQEVLGRTARRPHHARRLGRARGPRRAHDRHLQHDGHRLDDDLDRRGARLHAARRVVDSRRGFAHPRMAATAASARSRWSGRT